MSYRNERIVSAEHVSRPLQGSGEKISSNIGHHGVVVHTDQGNSYLIHNTPGSGVVATPANGMSSHWKTDHSIAVNGSHTVGDAMRGGYTSGSARLGNTGEYLGSGTCIGTAAGVERSLNGSSGQCDLF